MSALQYAVGPVLSLSSSAAVAAVTSFAAARCPARAAKEQ